MPIIHAYIPRGETREYKDAIAAGIHRAMVKVLSLPADDYFQLTHEMDLADMTFDRNYFGIRRSDRPVFISLAFNHRPPEPKRALFDAIVANLVASPGIAQADIYMNIVECAPENWWAFARTTDPESGLDSRMPARAR